MKKFLFLIAFALSLKADECAFLLANENNASTSFNKALFEASDKCAKSLQNQAATRELYRLANEIRGSNSACAGIHYLSNLQGFKTRLALIALKPVKFAPREDLQALKDYFEYWAYQSVGNFKLYKDFWAQFSKAGAPLRAYFEREFKLSKSAAKAYADNALNEFLLWAVGETKIFRKISEIEQIAASNDLSMLRNYIYTQTPDSTALSLALRAALLNNASTAVVEELLKFGAQINEGYESALFYALFSLENVKFLLERGADANFANAFGKTALFYAVEFNQMPVIRLLIDSGANVNAFYINKNEKLALSGNVGDSTPYYITLCALEHTSKSVFMHAAGYSDVEVLKLLVQKGADFKKQDDLGFNALDFALAANKAENAAYLRTLGLKENAQLQHYPGSLE